MTNMKNNFLNISWAVAICKERINENLQEVDGVVPSKWVNEEEKNTMVATSFACYQKAKHLIGTSLEEI